MLTSVEAIVEALGGTSATASIAGVGSPAVSNWKARGSIPAENFITFARALSERGLQADPSVFGFKLEARA